MLTSARKYDIIKAFPKQKMTGKEKRMMKMKKMQMALAGVTAAVLCVAATGCGKESVNVTKDISVTFEGFDGLGSA